jgi:hypothetical protein
MTAVATPFSLGKSCVWSIGSVGEDLGKLASLLEALDVPVPTPLVTAPASSTHPVQDPASEHRMNVSQ